MVLDTHICMCYRYCRANLWHVASRPGLLTHSVLILSIFLPLLSCYHMQHPVYVTAWPESDPLCLTTNCIPPSYGYCYLKYTWGVFEVRLY